MTEFRMPSLGADMETGTVLEWRVKPGDTVHRGDIVALIDTDKAEIETEIWDDGVVDRILVPTGQKVPVGTPLLALHAPGEAAEAPAEQAPAAKPATVSEAPPRQAPAAKAPAKRAEPPAKLASERAAPARVARISPRARRRAEELGVDLAAVHGTGADGAVTGADVERAAAPAGEARSRQAELSSAKPSAAPQPAKAAMDRLESMRRAIAAAMARSKREIPHYYLETSIDLTPALAWLETQNIRRSVTERILPAVLLLKATALGLHEVPELNGHWVDDAFRPANAVHLGVAISLRGGGLIAPAVHEAEKRTLDELMRALRDLVARTRSGGLRGAEVSDATATVTNLGDPGVEKVFGVIYPPQVALVGFGRVVERPWAQHGLLGVRRVVTATLSADHRASDGERGARFLRILARYLGKPESL